jgi:linoleoyl-CoA desaturase
MVLNNEQGAHPDFAKELYRRLNNYFVVKHLSKKADNRMAAKLIIALCWWLGSVVLLFTLHVNPVVFFLLYGFHCFAQLFILLNIAHDANHRAISKNPLLSNLLVYSFDICGVSSYMWRCLHHQQHHYCINIEGEDENLVVRGLFRFNEGTPQKFIHRFQHLYFLFFYGLFTIDWVFTKDFECFFFPHTTFLKTTKHKPKEYVKLFAGKLLYIGYMILLPIFYLGYPPVFVIAVFLACHFVIGVIGALVIQTTHPLASSAYPKSKNEYENFVYHVLATTSDYSVNRPLGKFFYGGLNTHVIHHLIPNACHTHYPELTAIIKSTADEYGVTYRENKTMYEAVCDHYKLLKQMSKRQLQINPSIT